MMARFKPIENDVLRLVSCDDAGRLFWTFEFDPARAGAELHQVTTEKGYKKVYIRRRPIFVHRLIWKLSMGNDPETVDHINGDRSDNRISNLRAATIAQNQWNMMPRGGASAFKGVYAAKGGRWGSRIKVSKRTRHLGTYDSEVEAAMAYDEASKKLHGKYSKTNSALGLL